MRDAMSASLLDGPSSMTEERFNSILRFSQPLKRIPEQVVELDHVVDNMFDIVDVVPLVVDRPDDGDEVNHLASSSDVKDSSLKAGRGRSQLMESVSLGRYLRWYFQGESSPVANETCVLATRLHGFVVRVFVLPHVIVARRQALYMRQKLEAKASGAIERFATACLASQPVLHCRNCDGDKNRRDASDCLYPSWRVLAERNWADHAKQSKSDQKPERDQCNVAKGTCPAGFAFQEIHPISPRWSRERIRTPSRTGEVT